MQTISSDGDTFFTLDNYGRPCGIKWHTLHGATMANPHASIDCIAAEAEQRRTGRIAKCP